jgi:hypothetical protein
MVVVNLHCAVAADGVSQTMFICDQKYRFVGAECAWTAKDATEKLQLQRCQGTEAAGSGDDLLASGGFDLGGDNNTVYTATLQTTDETRNDFADGDRLVAEFTAPIDTLAGMVCTAFLIPDGDKRYWISEG